LRDIGTPARLVEIANVGECPIVTTGLQAFSLAGRIALVTGASRGLGLAMAEGLAEAGAVVALNGRNADALNDVASDLHGRGLKAEIAPFDVTDQQAGKDAIENIITRHGRLDILVANAGINHRVPLADWTPVDWDRLLTANLKACFFLAQQVTVPMREQRHGRIIFTTSIAGIQARSAIHGYAASKSGLVGLTRSLACELGEYGITCNGICPGYFETDLTKLVLQSEEYVGRLNSRVPLRRWGRPRDLAGVVVFLASDAASYITGQQIVIDGGFTTTI
jgi:gluconate 5-dehydrogenase